MLSSKVAAPAKARAHSAGRSASSSSTTTTSLVRESVTYRATFKTVEHGKGSPLSTPKKLGPEFDNYSTQTTVPYSPNVYGFDEEVAEKEMRSKVIDIASGPSPVSSIESYPKINHSGIRSETKLQDLKCSVLKRNQPELLLPATPTSKPPPKKKSDTCPSDEKLFGRKAKVVEQVNKENQCDTFASVAPYSVYSNSEDTARDASKKLLCRGDKETQLSAFTKFKNKDKSQKILGTTKPTKQSVITGDHNNNISFRVPTPPPLQPVKQPTTKKKENTGGELYAKKSGEWSLGTAAYKSATAFKNAARTRRSSVSANRGKDAVAKIIRATDKESEDVYGEILGLIRIGKFDPAKAKVYVDSFEAK